jgi:ribosomal 50S subunit-recycling heat shock protein
VRLDGRKLSRASALVRIGNVLTIVQRGRVDVWRVEGFAPRRVSPKAALDIRVRLEEKGMDGQ